MNYEPVTLISLQKAGKDADGYDLPPTEKRTDVLAKPKSVAYGEFYEATKADFQPVIIFEVYAREYAESAIRAANSLIQAKFLEHEGVRYKIIRTYRIALDKLDLTCEEVER